MVKGHVMMVPYPAQGHVIPLLELAHILARHQIRITFVNTEFIHDRIVKSSSGEDNDGRIRFVSVPDGLEPLERDIPGKLIETVWRDMPQKIEELVHDLHQKEEEKVTCLVFDHNFGTIQKVAKKMGIQSAVFSPTPAAVLVSAFNIPKMIEDGIIDNEGTPLHDNAFQLSPTMPIMTASDLVWHRIKPEISTVRKLIFNIMRENSRSIKSADWVVCNSICDLEPGAFTVAPEIVPIGPLLPSNREGRNSAGHLWEQDSGSLEWLDHQAFCSVIFVAFGSTTIFNKPQFQELALGLERTNRPFLWAVRPDRTEKLEFPEGFLERVGSRGRITGWVPQQKVLSHPSIACFVCHAGWNSTMECLSNGVPMLCWPYSADNFISQSYICDILQVGLRFELDHSGAVEEFKRKMDLLLGEVVFKERALQLKEMIVSSAREGGSSCTNLRNFVSWIQE